MILLTWSLTSLKPRIQKLCWRNEGTNFTRHINLDLFSFSVLHTKHLQPLWYWHYWHAFSSKETLVNSPEIPLIISYIYIYICKEKDLSGEEDCKAAAESTTNLVMICHIKGDTESIHCHIFFVAIFKIFFPKYGKFVACVYWK